VRLEFVTVAVGSLPTDSRSWRNLPSRRVGKTSALRLSRAARTGGPGAGSYTLETNSEGRRAFQINSWSWTGGVVPMGTLIAHNLPNEVSTGIALDRSRDVAL
jgi:hypothetical protein